MPRGGLRPPGPPLACPECGAPCSPGPLPAELSRSGGLGEAVAPGAAPAAFVLVSLRLGVPMGPGLSLGGLCQRCLAAACDPLVEENGAIST